MVRRASCARRWALARHGRRFFLLVAAAAFVVLIGVGVGSFALADGFGPTTGTWTNLAVKVGFPSDWDPFDQNAAYDPMAGMVIWGRYQPTSDVMGQTCAYGLNTNTVTELKVPGVAPTSWLAALAYDDSSGRVIRLGVVSTKVGDTWAYDFKSNSWTDLKPTGSPPPLGGPVMAYDPILGKIVLLGRVGLQSRTWAYDSAANTWTELHTNGAPPPRHSAAMVYDENTGRLIVFGGVGFSASGDPLADTWAFDSKSSTWVDLQPAGPPPARAQASMAYDRASGRVILFGGWGRQKPYGDTWAYDSRTNTWAKLHTSGSPAGRSQACLFYDRSTGRLIMVGGLVVAGGESPRMLDEAWAFSS
jgi:Galactose oxidase, central domain